MSSFGTEDTHHNLHTLRWGYDGHLYMNQSIYTHTHVETPFGVRRLNSAGIWRFRPETWQFEVLHQGRLQSLGPSLGPVWEPLLHRRRGLQGGLPRDGGGDLLHLCRHATRGREHQSPATIPSFAAWRSCTVRRFPADWQGQLITCDFRAHRIVRFGLKDVGSTFQTVELPDLARSTNVTFRPIDLRLGPRRGDVHRRLEQSRSSSMVKWISGIRAGTRSMAASGA
jgi:hypothetical protein